MVSLLKRDTILVNYWHKKTARVKIPGLYAVIVKFIYSYLKASTGLLKAILMV